MGVPKWSEKLALVILLWLFFQYICLKNVNFWWALIFKKTFVGTSSEACSFTPKKCFPEEGKSVQKWSQKHKLFWSHSFVLAYRILASEIIIFCFFISERIFSGYCYVICNCNAANMDVVALYLSEQLNNNFILYTREINFSVHIYIFCPPFLLAQSEENFVKCSHDREEILKFFILMKDQSLVNAYY